MSNYIRRCKVCKVQGEYIYYMGQVQCPKCGRSTRPFKNKKDAVKDWREMNKNKKQKKLHPIMQTLLWACGWLKERW